MVHSFKFLLIQAAKVNFLLRLVNKKQETSLFEHTFLMNKSLKLLAYEPPCQVMMSETWFDGQNVFSQNEVAQNDFDSGPQICQLSDPV